MMSIIKTHLFILMLCFGLTMHAQDDQNEKTNTIDKKSYYKKRALEDAQYEQKFTTKNQDEDDTFWKEQKAYEKELKRKDRKAYKAYMKGKKDAYAEHYGHCNSHCNHSRYYYEHASFYYYRYPRYYQQSQRQATKTHIQVNTPRVSVGLF